MSRNAASSWNVLNILAMRLTKTVSTTQKLRLMPFRMLHAFNMSAAYECSSHWLITTTGFYQIYPCVAPSQPDTRERSQNGVVSWVWRCIPGGKAASHIGTSPCPLWSLITCQCSMWCFTICYGGGTQLCDVRWFRETCRVCSTQSGESWKKLKSDRQGSIDTSVGNSEVQPLLERLTITLVTITNHSLQSFT